MCLQHTRKLALLKGKACKALCGQKISLFGVLIGSRNGGDAVCSPSFCWSLGAKIGFAEVQPILTWEAKLCIKLLTSKHFSEKMQHFFAWLFLTSRFAILGVLNSGFWTAEAAKVRINRIFAAPAL